MQENNRSRAGKPKTPSVTSKKDDGAGQAKCLPGPGSYEVDKRHVNEENQRRLLTNGLLAHTREHLERSDSAGWWQPALERI